MTKSGEIHGVHENLKYILVTSYKNKATDDIGNKKNVSRKILSQWTLQQKNIHCWIKIWF